MSKNGKGYPPKVSSQVYDEENREKKNFREQENSKVQEQYFYKDGGFADKALQQMRDQDSYQISGITHTVEEILSNLFGGPQAQDQKFGTNWLSLKFKQSNMESCYKKHFNDYISPSFQKLSLLQVVLGFLIAIPTNILRIYQMMPEDPLQEERRQILLQIFWVILICCTSLLFLWLNYFLGKRYKEIGLLFSSLQTLNLVISLTEISIHLSETTKDYIDYTGRVQCVLLSTYTLCSYNQAYMLFTYFLAGIYFGLRTYIGIANESSLSNYLLYQYLGLTFLYLASRAIDSQNRSQFLQLWKNRCLLDILYSNLERNQDAILITKKKIQQENKLPYDQIKKSLQKQNPQILYFNKQLAQILEITQNFSNIAKDSDSNHQKLIKQKDCDDLDSRQKNMLSNVKKTIRPQSPHKLYSEEGCYRQLKAVDQDSIELSLRSERKDSALSIQDQLQLKKDHQKIGYPHQELQSPKVNDKLIQHKQQTLDNRQIRNLSPQKLYKTDDLSDAVKHDNLNEVQKDISPNPIEDLESAGLPSKDHSHQQMLKKLIENKGAPVGSTFESLRLLSIKWMKAQIIEGLISYKRRSDTGIQKSKKSYEQRGQTNKKNHKNLSLWDLIAETASNYDENRKELFRKFPSFENLQDDQVTPPRILQTNTTIFNLKNAYSQEITENDSEIIQVTTIRDLSEMIDAERQSCQDSLMTATFTSVAEEFKYSIDQIQTSLNLLGDIVEMDSSGKIYFEKSRDQVKFMMYQIQDIIDYSLLKENQLVIHEQQCDIQQIIEESISLFKHAAKEKKLNISMSVDKCLLQAQFNNKSVLFGQESSMHKFKLDKMKLQKIIVNNLRSAIQLCREKDAIKVHASKSFDDLRIVVEIPSHFLTDSQRKDVFQDFTNVFQGNQRYRNLPGLGMWINKLMAEAMRGKLELHSSRTNGGTRYILTIPMRIRHSFNDQSKFKKGAAANAKNDEPPIFNDQLSGEQPITMISRQADPKFILDQFYQERSNFKLKQKGALNDCLPSILIQNEPPLGYQPFLIDSTFQQQYYQKNYNKKEDPRQEERKQELERNIDDTCQCSKIMVVDEEPYNMISIEEFFMKCGVSQIDKSFSEADALKKYQANIELLSNKYNQQSSCPNHKPYQIILLNYSSSIVGSDDGKRLAQSLRKMQQKQLLQQSASSRKRNSQIKEAEFLNIDHPKTRIVAIMNDDGCLRSHQYNISENSQPLFDYMVSRPLDQQKLQTMLDSFNI